jgi:hypothetical protein
MSDAIIVALITGGLSLIGVIITSARSNQQLFDKLDKQSEVNDQKLDAKLERFQAVTDTKLDELTREVRRHNDFAERIPTLEEKAKAADRRLTDLEHRAG